MLVSAEHSHGRLNLRLTFVLLPDLSARLLPPSCVGLGEEREAARTGGIPRRNTPDLLAGLPERLSERSFG